MRSRGPPRCGHGVRGAWMALGDGELNEEDAAVEEVLVPEAITVGSHFGWLLDVAVGTAVIQVDSDRDGGGQWWRSPLSRDGRRRARTGLRQCVGGGARRRKEGLHGRCTPLIVVRGGAAVATVGGKLVVAGAV
jgi:hypothetical protein